MHSRKLYRTRPASLPKTSSRAARRLSEFFLSVIGSLVNVQFHGQGLKEVRRCGQPGVLLTLRTKSRATRRCTRPAFPVTCLRKIVTTSSPVLLEIIQKRASRKLAGSVTISRLLERETIAEQPAVTRASLSHATLTIPTPAEPRRGESSQ